MSDDTASARDDAAQLGEEPLAAWECGACIYFEAYEDPGFGLCQRHAPKRSLWPEVGEFNRCGEWRCNLSCDATWIEHQVSSLAGERFCPKPKREGLGQ